MAQGANNYDSIPGLKATGDLSSSQYKAVKMSSTAGSVKVCSATTDIGIGVLQNKPKDGQPAEVAFFGICKAQLAASVTVAKPLLYPNTTGQLQGTSVMAAAVIGQAFEASSATPGEIHPIMIGR